MPIVVATLETLGKECAHDPDERVNAVATKSRATRIFVIISAATAMRPPVSRFAYLYFTRRHTSTQRLGLG